MDTGKGDFAEISEPVAKQLQEKKHPVFQEGEIIELKGSRFRVKKIRQKDLVLRLLPNLKGE